MDPNATLDEIRDILKNQRARESAERLRELIESLDQWLSKGGFLPEAWEKKGQKDHGS